MKQTVSVLFLLFYIQVLHAQELYPVFEPASNVPKGALGVRAFGEGYKEADIFRSTCGIRLLYGATSRLSVYTTVTFSDYHEKSLPFDFINHHSSGAQNDSTATPKEGVVYPMIFNSVDVYAKYRFLTMDGEHRHFRMAAYAEGSYVAVPSHEAEPDLTVHTPGVGGGIIATYLKQHFAASVTLGFIVPANYKGNTYDNYGGVYPTTIKYGNAANYSVSFGYLLLPGKYRSYRQTNLNLYCELAGKNYGAASVREQDGPYAGALTYTLPNSTPILQAGAYVDVIPGIQLILGSTYRIDVSAAFALLNQSYAHLYPLYLVGVQRYFYFNKRSAAGK